MSKSSSILIITDATILYEKGKNYIFNSIALELEVVKWDFDRISLIGIGSGRSMSSRKELLEVDEKIRLFVQKEFIKEYGIVKLLIDSINYLILLGRLIRKHDVIHVRGPGYPMFMSIIMCFIFPSKLWWFKFANIWKTNTNSTFWNFQKKTLTMIPWIKVTVNGKRKSDPRHILDFENPCLFLADRREIHHKLVNPVIRIVFAGRITQSKGILLALNSINKHLGFREDLVCEFMIVGSGDISIVESFKSFELANLKVSYLGSISKEKLLGVFNDSDFLLLPTRSPEGFPKVVAEAMSMGCIPIVTDISAIPDYVTHGVNGFLLNSNVDLMDEIINCFNEIYLLGQSQLDIIRQNAQRTAYKYFTYERFIERVRKEVLEIA
jgi:glycosyltransferase involved in cell wall biosynthesis